MRSAKFLFSFIFVLSVSGVAFAMGSVPTSMTKEMTGKMAPNFQLDTLEEKNVDMTAYRDGKKAIIFFWATWCPHCRTQLKELNRDHDAITQKGIKIILVDVGEEAQEVAEYAERGQIKLDIFLDKESTVSEAYQVIGVPTFFFVNEKGDIVTTTHSLPSNLEEVFK